MSIVIIRPHPAIDGAYTLAVKEPGSERRTYHGEFASEQAAKQAKNRFLNEFYGAMPRDLVEADPESYPLHRMSRRRAS